MPSSLSNVQALDLSPDHSKLLGFLEIEVGR